MSDVIKVNQLSDLTRVRYLDSLKLDKRFNVLTFSVFAIGNPRCYHKWIADDLMKMHVMWRCPTCGAVVSCDRTELPPNIPTISLSDEE